MIPIDQGKPIKRVNFLQSCNWVGPDSQLSLRMLYTELDGSTQQVSMSTRNLADGTKGEVCLPTSSDLLDLGPRWEDVLVAHARMASLIAGAVPGSTEFTQAFLEGPSQNLNTSIGVVKVTSVVQIDDQTVAMTFRQGTGTPRVVNVDMDDLIKYKFVPSTQLFCTAGAIKRDLGYVHDYPNTLLTQARKDEIVAYVLARQPWI